MCETSNAGMSRSRTLPSWRQLRLRLMAAAFLGVLAVTAEPSALQAQSNSQPAALLHIAQDKDGREDYRTFKNTQAVLVTTRTVLSAALKKPKVADLALLKRQKDPVGWLRNNLQVDFPRDGEVLRITLTAADPNDAALIVNAVADSYLEELGTKEQNTRQRKLDALTKLVAEYEDNLKMKRRALRDLAEEGGSIDAKVLEERQRFQWKELDSMERELLDVRSKVRQALIELKSLEEAEKKPGDAPPPDKIDEQIDRDAAVQQVRARVVKLESYLQEYKAKSNNPEKEAPFQQMEKELQEAQSSLEIRRAALRPVLTKQAQEKSQADKKAAAAQVREKSEALQKTEKLLSDVIDKKLQEVRQSSKTVVGLESLRGEIVLLESTYRKIAAEREDVQVNLSASSPRITLVEKAEAPQRK
jgi:hypothetical protein